MKIIGITSRESGCGYHRVVLPLGFMDGIKGYVTNWITEDKMDGWDILLFNRICAYDSDWDKAKEILGCKVVMDIDDYWRLPPNHMNYRDYEAMGLRIENNLRHADMVTVTNEALAEKVRPFNENVHIFENGLPYGQNQFIENRREDERIRIFWAGGVTHEHDIKLLRGAVNRLSVHKNKIKMVMGGYSEASEVVELFKQGKVSRMVFESALYTECVWNKMFSSFTSGGKMPYMKLHGTLPVSYMQMYEYADIMVIPLEDTEWHSCKSNLKILEAACKRIPCIVSNVEPYSKDPDAPVLWVNNQTDWFRHLNFLIQNPAAREDMGNKLYEWATRKYHLKDINIRRAEAFRNLCQAPAHLRVLQPDGGDGELSLAHPE